LDNILAHLEHEIVMMNLKAMIAVADQACEGQQANVMPELTQTIFI
jgi:hypothetical protein